MANSRTPSNLKNCNLQNPSLLFGPLAQYLGSDKRWVSAIASHFERKLGGCYSPTIWQPAIRTLIQLARVKLLLHHSRWRGYTPLPDRQHMSAMLIATILYVPRRHYMLDNTRHQTTFNHIMTVLNTTPNDNCNCQSCKLSTATHLFGTVGWSPPVLHSTACKESRSDIPRQSQGPGINRNDLKNWNMWHRGPKPVACRFWLFLLNHIPHCIGFKILFTVSKYLVSNWSYTHLIRTLKEVKKIE